MKTLLLSLFFTRPTRWGETIPPSARIASGSAVFLSLALLFYFAFSRLEYGWGWSAVFAYREKFLRGWLTTVAISTAALVLSLAVGLAAALARRSGFLPARYLARLFTETLRGTPLLVQILVFFYVVADAFGVGNRYVVGTLTLSLFAGAYIGEILRAGIENVSESQWDSARAVGLTPSQIYRYIVFPQVVRRSLPPLAGQFASLIKDSSLLSVIAVSEFTLSAQEVNAYTFSTLESYLPLALGYLVLTLPISLWSRTLEKRFHYAT